ncbi:hypothetical protein JCM8097_005626 [Rhodosporidiobolus ruineniae]
MLAPALAAFALSSALNPHFLLAAAAPLYERQASLASCLRRNGLQPITAQSSNFTQDTEAYNERLQPNPAALFYPSSPDDIASALTCAASTSTQVSARGGGHSYASYSLGGDDGALVVDLNAFRDISVDENGLAKIGAGNRLGDIYLALNEEGWAFAAGTCPGVGIGGHAGFGGFGLSSRMWGFASDQVVGYDVVLANGTVLTNLTRESNEDLFWGLNGAAPNFGVVTSYYLQAHHAPVNAVVFSYTYTSPSTTIAATALHSYEQFANLSAPANLGMITNIGVDTLSVTGVWYGPRAEFDQVIQPLKDELPPSFDESVQEKDWIGAQAQLAGDPLDTQGKMLQSRDTFYAKSLMTPSTIPIDITVWESFLDYLWQSNTSTNWFVEIDTYGGQNSEINVRGLNESSFGHRDKLLTFQLYASSPTYGLPWVDEGTSFVQGMFDTIVDGMTSASPAWSTDSTSPDGYAAYVNYVDPNLSFDDVKNLYWGSQYDRLAQLKAEYDPEQVLHNPQSIQPANSTDA